MVGLILENTTGGRSDVVVAAARNLGVLVLVDRPSGVATSSTSCQVSVGAAAGPGVGS